MSPAFPTPSMQLSNSQLIVLSPPTNTHSPQSWYQPPSPNLLLVGVYQQIATLFWASTYYPGWAPPCQLDSGRSGYKSPSCHLLSETIPGTSCVRLGPPVSSPWEGIRNAKDLLEAHAYERSRGGSGTGPRRPSFRNPDLPPVDGKRRKARLSRRT